MMKPPGLDSSASEYVGIVDRKSSMGFSEITVQQLAQRKSLMNQYSEEQKEETLPYVKLRCIVANDNSFQLMACKLNLQKFNIEVIEAVNGYEAVQKVKKAISDKLEINFILLDLNMPILDGY